LPHYPNSDLGNTYTCSSTSCFSWYNTLEIDVHLDHTNDDKLDDDDDEVSYIT